MPKAKKVNMTIAYYQSRNGHRLLSHSYDETWEQTDIYCPCCGRQHVWHEAGPGDYYVGEEFICIGCRSRFYLPTGLIPITGQETDPDVQRIDFIRLVEANRPPTTD